MIILPFRPEHAAMIALQAKQREISGHVNGSELFAAGPAVTGMINDRVIFCGGKAMQWEGRWILWALLSDEAKRHMVSATRCAKRFISEQVGGRVEAIVRCDFKEGHRWVKLVGLDWHHREERFLPGGLDADVYVRFC